MIRLHRLFPALFAAVALWGCGGGARTLPYPEDRPPTADAPKAEPPAAGPQEQKPIDLLSALRLAAGSHLDVLEAKARRREAEGRADAADGALLPSIGANAGVLKTRGTTQSSSTGDLNNATFETVTALGVVRLSTNVGESIYHDLAAHRLADASAEVERAVLQRTLQTVTLGYLALVEADAVVRIQDQFVLEAQSLLRLTAARESQGLGTALDTERARALAAAAEQRLLAARNDRQRRSKELSASLRLDSTLDLAPVDKDLAPAKLLDPGEDLAPWLRRAADQRPEARALLAGRMAAQHETDAARWGLWGPELSAGAAVGGLGKSIPTVDERENFYVALGWTFSFGGPGRIEAAEARVDQAGLAMDRFRENLQASVAGAFHELALARQRLDPAERELAASEKALRIARATYEGGLLAESDLLLAQQSADQARLRRLGAVARYNEAQIRLLSESGVATVESLTGSVPK